MGQANFPSIVNNRHGGNWVSASGHFYTEREVMDAVGSYGHEPSIVLDAGAGPGGTTENIADIQDDVVVLAVDPYAGYGEERGDYFEQENAFAVDMDVKEFLDGVEGGEISRELLERVGINCSVPECASLNTVVASGFFVSTDDPVSYLQEISAALPEGGRLIRSGPDSEAVTDTAPASEIGEKDKVYEVSFPYETGDKEGIYTQLVPKRFAGLAECHRLELVRQQEVSFNPRGLRTLSDLLVGDWQDKLGEHVEQMEEHLGNNGIEYEGGIGNWKEEVFEEYVELGKEEAILPKGELRVMEKASG